MEPRPRPLLRGYIHAFAVVPMGVAALLLVGRAAGDWQKQLSFAVYGVSAILLFGISATYHVGRWSAPVRRVLRQCDHATIFILIAGTTTPCAYNLLGGALRWTVLALTWSAAGVGVALVGPYSRFSDGWAALTYFAVGVAPVLTLPALVAQVGWSGVLLPLSGGALYGLGALAYARQRPSPWPGVFGFHEVFHTLTIAANAAFYAFLFLVVAPAVRPA